MSHRVLRFLGQCLLAIVVATAAAAPAVASPADTTCSCAELLEALRGRVEANHPGYHLEIRGTDAEQGYVEHLAATRHAADAARPGIDCLRVLQNFVAWFEDGHLFVGGAPRPTSASDSARLRQAAPRVDRSEAEARRYLDGATVDLDPVEGIWYDATGTRFAVVRDDRAPAGGPSAGFVAFVLESPSEAWRTGDVKARLTAMPDGSYDAVLYDDARSATRPHVWARGKAGGARLQRQGLLLHMPPLTWGREYPLRAEQQGLLDPDDPRAPTVRVLEDGTVVFHVPSHVYAYGARIAAFVQRHREALEAAATLIIDLRGNEGGSSTATNALMPFLAGGGHAPARYHAEGEAAVLASADNLAYFRRQNWAPPGLVERLERAAPGTLVPFADERAADQGSGQAARDVEAHRRPRNLAILTDAMTVSAAEAFVLQAMRHGGVTLFGEPTGSSIDYQTVGIVRFGCPEAGLYVGYPTIVGSDRLPEGGVRPTGIVPDVSIPSSHPDPIGRILEYYRQRG